jgi:hypothetical protein
MDDSGVNSERVYHMCIYLEGERGSELSTWRLSAGNRGVQGCGRALRQSSMVCNWTFILIKSATLHRDVNVINNFDGQKEQKPRAHDRENKTRGVHLQLRDKK